MIKTNLRISFWPAVNRATELQYIYILSHFLCDSLVIVMYSLGLEKRRRGRLAFAYGHISLVCFLACLLHTWSIFNTLCIFL